VLVLLATIAVSWARAVLAAAEPPSGSSGTDHASRLRKLARRVVAHASHQVGVGYSWGGTSPATGFDCSGGPVRFARLRPGDLLFTEGSGHVQLVVSKRAAISASQTGERVRYVSLAHLRPEFAGAQRLLR
jgi:cell wall-associated NlpC family hydrolase